MGDVACQVQPIPFSQNAPFSWVLTGFQSITAASSLNPIVIRVQGQLDMPQDLGTIYAAPPYLTKSLTISLYQTQHPSDVWTNGMVIARTWRNAA